MGHPPKQLVIGIPTASFDGKYYGRYPQGNKPQGAALNGPAIEVVSANANLATAIRLAASAAGAASAAADLTTGAGGGSTNFTNRSLLAYNMSADSLTTGAAAPAEFWNGVVSTAQAYSGTKSIALSLVNGSTTAGLNVDYYNLLGYAPAVGDEAWFSLRVFVPTTVDWSATPGWLKWLRFRVSRGGSAETNIRGIYSLLKSSGAMDYVYEGINTQITLSAATNNAPPIGSWVTLEIYCKFSLTSKDSGGGGEFKFYRNGTMVGHITSQATMTNADDHCHEFSWIDYWNGGAHANQTVYVDDICSAVKIAGHRDDSVYLVSDGNGGLMIGL